MSEKNSEKKKDTGDGILTAALVLDVAGEVLDAGIEAVVGAVSKSDSGSGGIVEVIGEALGAVGEFIGSLLD